MRDNLPRINKPRYAHTIMNKLCKARIFLIRTRLMLQISNPQNFTKKNRRWNIFFFIWTQELYIFNEVQTIFLGNFISIGENWLNKKTTPSIDIPFSSKVGTKTQNIEIYKSSIFMLDLATLSTQKAPDHSWTVFNPAKLVCISFEGSRGQITAWYNCFLKNRMLIVRR